MCPLRARNRGPEAAQPGDLTTGQGLDRREVRPITATDTPFARAQRDQLAVLLDALDGVVISDAERRSLAWLAGWEKHVLENIATVIRRARATGELAPACLWCSTRPAPHSVHGDPLCESCFRDHRG